MQMELFDTPGDEEVLLPPPSEEHGQDDGLTGIAGFAARAVGFRTVAQAIAWAEGQIKNRTQNWQGWCQKFVRTSWGVGGGFGSAIAQWNGAKYKHPQKDPMKIPKGAAGVFWRGGKHGHVALPIGNGRCISTDARRRGWPDIVTIDSITKSWGYELLGWTEDINGVRMLPKPKPKRRPKRIRVYAKKSKREIRRLVKAREAARKRGENLAPYTRLIKAQRLARQARLDIPKR